MEDDGASMPTYALINTSSLGDDERSCDDASVSSSGAGSIPRLPGGLERLRDVLWTHRHGLIVGIFGFTVNLPFTFVQPFLPQMKQDYFGTAQRAALMNAIFDTVTAVIGFLLAGLYARMLNAYGRRPFFLAAAVGTVGSYVAFVIGGGSNPVPYMVVNHVFKLFIPSYAAAYVADTVSQPATRVRCFALYVAGQTLSAVPGVAIATQHLTVKTGAWIALGLSVLPLLWAVLVLRESLPVEQRVPMTLVGLSNPMSGVGIILKYRLLGVLSLVFFLGQIADTGVGELLLQYLIHRLHLKPADFAVVSVEAAILGPVSLFIIFPLMLRLMSAPMVLTVLVGLNGGVLILIATVWAKWVIYAVIMPVISLLSILAPLINGIISNSTEEAAQQALRLTAIAAVREVVGAIAPLPMTLLFAELPPSLLSVPFFVGAGLLLSGAMVALLIPRALEYDVRMEAKAMKAAEGGVAGALLAEEDPAVPGDDEARQQQQEDGTTQARLRAATLLIDAEEGGVGSSPS